MIVSPSMALNMKTHILAAALLPAVARCLPPFIVVTFALQSVCSDLLAGVLASR